jgi:chromosome segregation ATPase
MPVNPKSIEALTNPETFAKSLATRRRNRENREALKQKLAFEKLDQQTQKLVSELKNQVAEESILSNRTTNVEYQIKSVQVQQDALKEHVNMNSNAIKELRLINANANHAPSGGPGGPSNISQETELYKKCKGIKTELRANMQKVNEEIERLDDKLEENDTNISHLQFQMKELASVQQKINLLFGLVYDTTPNRALFNEYCPTFECPIRPAPRPLR